MQRISILTLAAATVGVLLALPAQARPDGPAAERYIVVLEAGVNADAFAEMHARRYGAQVGFVYRHALAGYAAVIPDDRVAAVRADDNVAYVEPDGVVEAVAQTLPWGIDRIDADVSSTLAGNGSGAISISSGMSTSRVDGTPIATATGRTSRERSLPGTIRATSSAPLPVRRLRA
jgi:subtilisin